MTTEFDSIIFDMDGTLWDAVDSYAEIWNTTSDFFGISRRVTRAELLQGMGMPVNKIVDHIFGDSLTRRNDYLRLLLENEEKMTRILGGKLYDGVSRGIELLSEKYKLLMASNCGSMGLRNFLEFTKLQPFFTDTITNGETGLDKAENIKIIISRNNLKKPVYVGDTQHDCDSAHKAGIPMIFATYGFGNCSDPDASVNSFNQLVSMLTNN